MIQVHKIHSYAATTVYHLTKKITQVLSIWLNGPYINSVIWNIPFDRMFTCHLAKTAILIKTIV